MNCRHGFVVRDILGVNRFLCRECKERFTSYPRRSKPTTLYNPPITDKMCWQIIDDALKQFVPSFVKRINQPGFVMAKGVPTKRLTYNLPLTDKVTQSFAFLGDHNE